MLVSSFVPSLKAIFLMRELEKKKIFSTCTEECIMKNEIYKEHIFCTYAIFFPIPVVQHRESRPSVNYCKAHQEGRKWDVFQCFTFYFNLWLSQSNVYFNGKIMSCSISKTINIHYRTRFKCGESHFSHFYFSGCTAKFDSGEFLMLSCRVWWQV